MEKQSKSLLWDTPALEKHFREEARDVLSLLKMFEWVAFNEDIWIGCKYLIIVPAFYLRQITYFSICSFSCSQAGELSGLTFTIALQNCCIQWPSLQSVYMKHQQKRQELAMCVTGNLVPLRFSPAGGTSWVTYCYCSSKILLEAFAPFLSAL